MAMTYQNFASLGVNLNRQKYGPLDISNVFTSAADLQYYLTKGTFTEGVSEYWYKNENEKVVPYPYEGQVLATVINGVVNVYALALDSEGNFITQEIAGKIEVDGKTIKLNDEGKIELVGLDNVEAGKTYVPSLVNGVLTWAEPDTSTAEGQAQEINGLKTRTAELEKTVNGVEASEGVEAVKGLVEKLADEVAAREAGDTALETKIAEALAEAKKYADDNDTDTAYDDTEVVGRVNTLEELVGSEASGLVKDVADNAKAISDMDAAYKAADSQVLTDAKDYADAELAGLTVAIEKKDDVEHIVIKNKAGEEVTSVSASKFVQDSFLNDVNYDEATGKVSFTWIMGDGSTKTDEIDIAHLVDTYTAGTGLTVENNEFSVDTEVIATVAALNEVKEIAEAAQTEEEVEAAIEAKITEADLDQYAVKSEVETTLEGYYTKEEVEGKGYAVATEVAETYATKEELEPLAKSEAVNAELAKKIETATIGHTTETQGEEVKVDGTELKIYVNAYTKEETLTKIQEKITEINGGESAGEVLSQLNSYKETNDARVGAIETKNGEQDTAITEAKAQADKGVADAAAANAAVEELAEQVNTNKTDLGTISNRLTDVETAKADHETRIVSAETKISALEIADNTINSKISAIDTRVSDLESEDARLAELIDTKANVSDVYTKTETDEAINTAISGIPAVDLEPYAKSADVAATVAQINADIETKANAEDVYTKEDADSAVAAAIKAVTGDVPEDKTVVELIEEAKTEATYDDAELTARVVANEEAIEVINGEESVEGSIAYAVKALADGAVKENADAIAVLNSDASVEGSVAKIADDRIAAALAGADADFDTLKEMSDWLSTHADSAATMNSSIAENTAAIKLINETTIPEAIEEANGYTDNAITELDLANTYEAKGAAAEVKTYAEEQLSTLSTTVDNNAAAIAALNGTGDGSVQKMVSDAIAGLPAATAVALGLVKASDEVTVAADGTMGIGAVPTDKLVQGLQTLVLNGGSAVN